MDSHNENYVDLSKISEGGSAIVYKGQQLSPQRTVAIKWLHAETDDATIRFKQEADLPAKFNDPAIEQIYEVGYYERRPYIVMEYVAGGDLTARLERGQLSEREGVGLLKKLCRVLHTIHECGIVHRDLKPSNILLDFQGHPKITDFGIARSINPGHSLTDTGHVVGTAAYISPEQAIIASDAAEMHATWCFTETRRRGVIDRCPRSEPRVKVSPSVCHSIAGGPVRNLVSASRGW